MADNKRVEKIFNIEEWVFLKLRANKQQTLNCKICPKQAPKYYGPLGIMGTVGQVAYKLLFPPGLCLYPVFHVSLSENAVGNY